MIKNLLINHVVIGILLFSNLCIGQENVKFKYEMTECMDGYYIGHDQFVSLTHNKGFSTLIFESEANCAGVHDVKVDYESDTINIRYTNFGFEYSDSTITDTSIVGNDTIVSQKVIKSKVSGNVIEFLCSCCFTFTFQLESLNPKREYVVILHEYNIETRRTFSTVLRTSLYPLRTEKSEFLKKIEDKISKNFRDSIKDNGITKFSYHVYVNRKGKIKSIKTISNGDLPKLADFIKQELLSEEMLVCSECEEKNIYPDYYYVSISASEDGLDINFKYKHN